MDHQESIVGEESHQIAVENQGERGGEARDHKAVKRAEKVRFPNSKGVISVKS